MRRASAHTPESDKFESASSPRKTSLLQAIMSCGPEKPDMYWSAPRAAERPVISVPEIGYVRRSELILAPEHLRHQHEHIVAPLPRRGPDENPSNATLQCYLVGSVSSVLFGTMVEA